jgi:hypothetical protein
MPILFASPMFLPARARMKSFIDIIMSMMPEQNTLILQVTTVELNDSTVSDVDPLGSTYK